jgi:C1A family cysteine protease
MFRKILVLALALTSVVMAMHAHEKDSYIFGRFQEFTVKHNKKYSSIEETVARFKVFQSNYARLESFSLNSDRTYSVGINKFADMTPQEFRKTYRNLDINMLNVEKAKSEGLTFSEAAPESHDWRKEGAVGPVKDQGQCGSCWAFSTVGNLEGLNYIKTKKFVQFAEQQLVDCDKGQDQGCNGGLMENAFAYLKTAGGLEKSSDYKYTARDGTCKFDKSKSAIQVTGSVFAKSQDEEEIKSFLYSTGPLAIAINAEPLQFYNGGIIDADANECDPQSLDHGVTLVGYGSENGQDYWIVRNSWGSGWGEEGYFRFARGKGTCGVNTYVISATLQ